MKSALIHSVLVLAVFIRADTLPAQVYSPNVLVKGQVDTRTLAALAQGIYDRAGARTDRQKAEAIWRFFLTDGRFVPPGFWYHIAGWAYEEPAGEVLDPLKLLNSYGFGLCYHIAPLLEAVWEAGGFADARVWFLTGHTVAEVFYDGAYHYFDSDMLGYNPIGKGNVKKLPVASVRQIEQDQNIILGKLVSPMRADPAQVDHPWYPADLLEGAMRGMAELFTSTHDNWLFPFTRYSQNHSMEFVLRPGERMVCYYQPEAEGLFYLPYRFDGQDWQEFPQEVERYRIRTREGPKSQKDNRFWSTGRFEYVPALADWSAYYPRAEFNQNLRLPKRERQRSFLSRELPGRDAQAVFEVRSPYVLIDAKLSIQARLETASHSVLFETSTDAGKSWDFGGVLNGPHDGPWQVAPGVKARSAHGVLTAISGTYGYLARLTMRGPGPAEAIQVSAVEIASRFQLNPRTLPELRGGPNKLVYSPGYLRERRVVPARLDRVEQVAFKAMNARYAGRDGQGFLLPLEGKRAEVIFDLSVAGVPLEGFDAAGRFLDLRDGYAPDKLTAEVRRIAASEMPGSTSPVRASLAWSTSPAGPYQTLWEYDPNIPWKDGKPVERTLRWPEVSRRVPSITPAANHVYVRYQFEGMALDNVELAVLSSASGRSPLLEVTHLWLEDGKANSHVERIEKPWLPREYAIAAGRGGSIVNRAVIYSCPAGEAAAFATEKK